MASNPAPLPTSSSLPPKPLSHFSKGVSNISWNHLRDNYEVSTWLCMGAVLQLILPAQLTYLPAAFLLLKVFYTSLFLIKLLPNRRFKNVLRRTYGASLPVGHIHKSGERVAVEDLPGNGDIFISMIAGQCHHPLGYLAPNNSFPTHIKSTIRDLEQNAEEFGFLGATSWLNTSGHTSNNIMMTLFYFRSREDFVAFYKSPYHSEPGKFVRQNGRRGDVGLYQENFTVRKGEFDSFGLSMEPTMFDATTFVVENTDGEKKWQSVNNIDLGQGMDFLKRRERFKDPHNPVTHWKPKQKASDTSEKIA